jgi:hypothetical protein
MVAEHSRGLCARLCRVESESFQIDCYGRFFCAVSSHFIFRPSAAGIDEMPRPVIRMCVAMAWPPKKPPGASPQPVTERVEGEPYGGLMHGDMHNGNSESSSASDTFLTCKYSCPCY